MESLRASRLCVRNLASVDYLFLNLLASLNLLDVTQLVNDNATYACDPSCFRTEPCDLEIQQIQGGQQILEPRVPTFDCWSV